MRHKWFAAVFAFGSLMSAFTIVLLIRPGTPLDALWRLNPHARLGLTSLGWLAPALMFVVGLACAFAAAGLWRGSVWGVRLALLILSINIAGDLFNALVRHDYRSLIGLPVGGAMIFYLAHPRNLKQ